MDYMTQLAERLIPLFRTPSEVPFGIDANEATKLKSETEAAIGAMKGGKDLLTLGSEPVVLELIAEAMFRNPQLAVRTSHLFQCRPEFINTLASPPRNQAVLANLWNLFRTESKDVVAEAARCDQLIGDPQLVLETARQRAAPVPFSLVQHNELEEIGRSREQRLAVDQESWRDQLLGKIERVDRVLGNGDGTPLLKEEEKALTEGRDTARMLLQKRFEPSREEPATPDAGNSATKPDTRGIPHPARAAAAMQLLGVSLSGGGIRSATFNLGILQGLARLDLLRRVDYLSTVSGGGYIGSWLLSLVRRTKKGIRGVQRMLSPRLSPDPEADQTRPIRFLREYSNYLTPRKGFLTADTWTMIAIWLRNTFLNFLVMLLFLATVLLVPRGPAALLFDAIPVWAAIAVAVILLLFASWIIGVNLSWFDPEKESLNLASGRARLTQQPIIQLGVVVPIFLAALLLVRPLISLIDTSTSDLPLFLIATAIVFLFLLVIQLAGAFHRCFYPGNDKPDGSTKRRAFLIISGFSLAAAAGTGGLLVLLTRILHNAFSCPDQVRVCLSQTHQIVFGPPIIIAILSCATVLQIGLLGRNFPDERREWWSRLGAWLLIYTVSWIGLAGVAIYGPLLAGMIGTWGRSGALAAWLGTAVGGVMMARSPQSAASQGIRAGAEKLGPRFLIAVAPYVFIAGLLVLVATAVLLFLGVFPHQSLSDVGLWETLERRYDWYFAQGRYLWPVWFCLGFGAFAWLLAQRFDVNEFSMHHFYKNRLVRCYLGSTRPARERNANRFTGFDLGDDSKLATLTTDNAFYGPYPVLTTALNLVKGDDLAAQERKAASFVFTPKYSGFNFVDRRPHPGASGELAPEGYRPTQVYGYGSEGGIGLGTAMAISGAAASPNQGYHSSSAASFLMTMFNARLGWWLGNPRHELTYGKSSPNLGLLYYLNDLLGNTTDRSDYVNLSDGGHFDNLGIYELVRRRCRYIIACDAEQDGSLTFGALGNAVRKCRNDFGVNIQLEPAAIRPAKAGERSRVHCVMGTIVYQDGNRGKLLYIKSSLTGDEPADVLEYAARRTSFPHQSTANQWFDESQFESYRALGYHIAMSTLRDTVEAVSAEDIGSLFTELEKRLHEAAKNPEPVNRRHSPRPERPSGSVAATR